LQQRLENTFRVSLQAAVYEYKDLQTSAQVLLDEATAFRGGSYFTCGLIDDSEQTAGCFKTGDVLSLAANARLELVPEDLFYATAEQAGLDKNVFERQQPLAFFRLCGWREEREDFRLILDRDLMGWGADRFGKALALKGFHLDATLPGLPDLNHRLCRRALPTLLCVGYHPLELKRRLRLPLLFALYSFQSRDGVEGCVAFGREALLLDARLRHTSLNLGGGAMIA
jgi:hypothetical protein